MSKYLLPCECGKAIAIDLSQAGQQLRCECGKMLEAPTLRGVRDLERAEEMDSPARQAAEWDPTRGVIFVGSLILLVCGAAVSFFGYDALLATPNISREVERESFDEAIDDMSLTEAYDTWKIIRDEGLGPRGQNPYVNIRNFRAGRQRMLAIGIALCLGGLLGAIGTMLGRRKSPA